MRTYQLLTALALTAVLTISAPLSAKTNSVIGNEQAITFTANDGQTTDAFKRTLSVPENRHNPKSRMIDLTYVRFPATTDKPGSPIVYLAGGPGGSGIGAAKWRRFPLFMAMRQYGDVIALEQRGAGESKNTPECISNQVLPMTKVISKQEVESRYRQAAKECVVFWQQQGADVRGYTTEQSALDLDDLRKHLSADKVSLWGISYGTHLALAAMKLMEDKVDKVILASAEGLNQTVKLPSHTDAYFGRVQQAINQQPELAARFPDIKGMMLKVNKQLEKQPMLVKVPAGEGNQADFLFQKSHMQGLTSMMIADPGKYLATLLTLYQTLEMGSPQVLEMVLQHGMFSDPRIKFEMMPFAMDVASGISDKRLKQFQAEASQSIVGEMLNFPMPMLNKAVPGLELGDNFRQAPQNSIPTLLLTGTLDGRTYIEGQKQATRGLKNLNQVMVVNAGHNLFTASPEVLQVMQDFMAGRAISKKEIQVALPSFKM